MKYIKWITMGLLVALLALALADLTGCGKSARTPLENQPITAQTSALKYRCEICGMEYSAGEAKKNNYKCTMDGGKLVPEK